MTVSPYTRERLAEAASSSRTLSAALRKLGVDPKSSSRRYIHTRMKSLGVDTSHFEREGARWTREILEAAVSRSGNTYEVLRRLGLDPVGGHHTHISRRIRSLGIDTSHFVGQSRERPTGRRPCTPEELLVESANRPRRVPGDRLRRAMLALGTEERCALCGLEPVWFERPLPFEVDHVDGNWRNNCRENLRLLCPNCHSTTDTYRGRSKRRRPSTRTRHATG
ncbi:HNH endonuclease signature motif containing protein [Streptomyces celluloflavus]|uniref:HNH endonuclease signature motif containing protein n=1 Tax=Streptomyces celluloflavus TaxID=58344 RepID=UPI0036B03070